MDEQTCTPEAATTWNVVATNWRWDQVMYRRWDQVMYRGMTDEAEAHALADMLNRQQRGVFFFVTPAEES